MVQILKDFIQDAFRAGKTREEVNSVLLQAGWPQEQLRDVWKQYHDTTFPVPVPVPTVYASPRLAALNLFYFIVLYLAIYSIVSILFTFLDYYLPNGVGQQAGFYYSHQPVGQSIRRSLSTLLVSAPLMLFSHRLIQTTSTKSAQSIPSIRLKLLSLTLLIAAITMLCNVIGLVYYFLSGELSLRFVIKVGVLSLLSACLYYYFKPEMQRNEAKG